MQKFIIDNEFYCCKCGNKGFSIPRKKGKQREAGHLKKLWCLNCKQETNHAECKPFTKYDYSDFMLEFTYNNFDENQKRIMPYGLFRAKLHNEGVDINAEKESFNNYVRGSGSWKEYLD